jgi:hypothetical protein
LLYFFCGATGSAAPLDELAGYHPAHTVIKCPYIPPEFDASGPPTCHGIPATCVGTRGHDLILGGVGGEVIMGPEGDDIICGGPGNDYVHGAKGADQIYGDEGDDLLLGARGDDRLYGGPGDFDTLWGGPGADYLDGGPGKFDVCMLQRELAEYNAETCNTVYPPPGYVHEEDPDPGIVRALETWELR